MNSGMYAALTGNINALKRLDVIANNLANTTTSGFKRDRLAFETQLQQAEAATASVPGGGDAIPKFSGDLFYTDFTPGPLQHTGNRFDFAIEGDGFIEVTTPEGPAYTRQGNFRLDSEGRLVTATGNPLSPEIVIPPSATNITVGSDGTVSAFMPGETTAVTVGTLQIVDFAKPYNLQKKGDSLFVPKDPQDTPQPATNATLAQGVLEGANVSAISEMVMMIENSRYFEACSKVVKSFDDMASKAANDLGKV
jgi:flagellar basal-body rod protein FlgG